MRRIGSTSFVLLLLLLPAVPARADATLFLGATTTPTNRVVRGGALMLRANAGDSGFTRPPVHLRHRGTSDPTCRQVP